MRRSSLNLLIDLLSFLLLMGLVFTGVIIKYVMPPGTGGLARELHSGAGREHIKEFVSLSRHQWGYIHFCISIVFVVLMLIHIILHWSCIKAYFRVMFGLKKTEESCD